MVSYASLTDHAAIEAAMADFDKLGRELFLLKTGFPENNEGFVITERGRYDVRALFASAYERQHERALTPSQVAAGMRAASGAFVALGYVVLSSDDQKSRDQFTSFDAALSAYEIPEANLPAIREFLATQSYRDFYVPRSGAYIGAKPRNGKPAHYISRGAIVYRLDDGRLQEITLPVRVTRPVEPLTGAGTRAKAAPRVPGSRASAPKAPRAPRATAAAERPVAYCDTCFLALPATGICANCD